MSDLTKAIKTLEPLAQAIVVLGSKSKDLENLEGRISELDARFEQRQDEWAAAEVAAKKARASVDQANAEVIAAKSRVEELSRQASDQAAKVIADAKKDAEAQAKDIFAGYIREHNKVKADITAAKATLAKVEADLAERQKAHDAVMASIETLSKRLVGA